jgi:hypothetical protein
MGIKMEKGIVRCYVSGQPTMWDDSEEEKQRILALGRDFRSYIWGDSGITNFLNKLQAQSYGQDLQIILLEFYLNPPDFTEEALRPVSSYDSREKSIGIPVIVKSDNFFSKKEKERRIFLVNTIVEKVNLLTGVVEKKKLDTDLNRLKNDLNEVLKSYTLAK